jgi:hypothetical protein
MANEEEKSEHQRWAAATQLVLESKFPTADPLDMRMYAKQMAVVRKAVQMGKDLGEGLLRIFEAGVDLGSNLPGELDS